MAEKIPEMEEMIEQIKKKQSDNEVMVFAIGAGRIAEGFFMSRKMRKPMREARKEILNSEGFLGIHPIDIWHTMLLYDTLNNAKGARNVLTSKGIQLGNIIPVLILKSYLDGKSE